MFHFSVDSQYVDFFKISDLESVGIQIDLDFQTQGKADAQRHDLPDKGSAHTPGDMVSNFIFKAERYYPGDIPDALLYIQKYFNQPPLCVWLNNTPYIIAGQHVRNIYKKK